MRFRKPVSLLVLVIIALSAVAAGYGLLSTGGPGPHEFTTVFGQTVTLHGQGLYRNDSVSAAAQARSQDVVTLALAIPLLAFALALARRGSLKGRLLLAGTLGYFLYSYLSLAFLATYNPLFLVYTAAFAASLGAFILTLLDIDAQELAARVSGRLPVRFIGGFQLFLGCALLIMWLGRIIPPLLTGGVPTGLDHYTTLVIQALDLGIMVPLAIISGILILRRDAYGYLLSAVTIIKGVTMLTAISAMIIGQLRVGDQVPPAVIAVFALANLIAVYCMVTMLRCISDREPRTAKEAIS
ncbi:MAG: hypothetical protein ACM3XN_09095 [Chloroflexota bacterium]